MTSSALFPDLPGDARVWVRPSTEPLSDAVQSDLVARLRAFIDTWQSHGRPVNGDVAVLGDRLLVLAARLDAPDGSDGPDGPADGGAISGCGIDASVHAIDEAAAALGIDWAPALHVVYRDADGAVQTAARPAFRALVGDGAVTGDTVVFDPSVTTLQQVRDGDFEAPARSTWHARVFQIPEPA